MDLEMLIYRPFFTHTFFDPRFFLPQRKKKEKGEKRKEKREKRKRKKKKRKVKRKEKEKISEKLKQFFFSSDFDF